MSESGTEPGAGVGAGVGSGAAAVVAAAPPAATGGNLDIFSTCLNHVVELWG